jgi:histidinol-phosphatase (PHP family)
MSLPPDDHVHTEFSWDSIAGSMERSCARAVELGLPSIAFTEHAEFTVSRVDPRVRDQLAPHIAAHVGADGLCRVPPLDTAGYLAAVARCRDRFPGLRIRSGLELSEPHWHPERVAALRAEGGFERILGSVHSLPTDTDPVVTDERYLDLAPEQVVRDYLAEVLALARSTADFEVLAHVDYAIRYAPGPIGWPGPYEEEIRAVLAALAASGRVLEINTVLPLDAAVVGWWREAGGTAVSFGTDAHSPEELGRNLAEAAALAGAYGFGPADDPAAFWSVR